MADDDVVGTWIRSHDEDHDDHLVLRPAGYPFPPARGRTAFALDPDGPPGWAARDRTTERCACSRSGRPSACSSS